MSNSFDLRDIPSWGFFGALMGYVIYFRAIQYFLFALQTGVISIPGFGSKKAAAVPAVASQPVDHNTPKKDAEGMRPMEIVSKDDKEKQNI